MGWMPIVAARAADRRRALARSAARQGRAAVPRRRACCSLSPAMPGRASRGSRAAPRRRRRASEVPDSDFAAMRENMLGRFDRAAAWLTIAESYQRARRHAGRRPDPASGLRAAPNDPDLWVGLGNALVVHGGGDDDPGRAARLPARRADRAAASRPALLLWPRARPGRQFRRGRADLAPAARRGAAPTPNIARRSTSGSQALQARAPRSGGGAATAAPAQRARDAPAAPVVSSRRALRPAPAASNGRPSASATAWWRILPPETLRPLARCGSAFIAASAPRLASLSTKGRVALLSAKAEVRATAPGMLATQ